MTTLDRTSTWGEIPPRDQAFLVVYLAALAFVVFALLWPLIDRAIRWASSRWFGRATCLHCDVLCRRAARAADGLCIDCAQAPATLWPPELDRRLFFERARGLLGMFLVAAAHIVGPPLELGVGLALAGLVAGLFGLVLHLAAKLPPEPEGKVTSGGGVSAHRAARGRRRSYITEPAEEGGRLEEYSRLDADSFVQLVGTPTRSRVR